MPSNTFADLPMTEKIHRSLGGTPDAPFRDMLSHVDDLASLANGTWAPSSNAEHDALDAYGRDFLSRFAYHTTAIEGSTLTPLETELVIEGEFVPSDDKDLRDLFAVRGVVEGYDYALRQQSQGRPLDRALIQDVHERTALDCQPRTRGAIRVGPVYIRGARTTPVPAAQVRDDLDALVYALERTDAHPVFAALAFHALFEAIHPFQDGNGRTGRTLLNVMLVGRRYPPIAIKHDDRVGYYEALEAWQVDGEFGPLVALVCASVAAECEGRIACVRETRENEARLRG